MSLKIEHVTSTANPTVKILKSLDRKKARNDHGLFLAEGTRLVREADSQGWQADVILTNASELERPDVRSFLESAHDKGTRIISCTPKVLGAVARKDNPQTLVAAFKTEKREIDSIDLTEPFRVIALYQIRDPGNLGTILRTADASGVSAVLLIEQCCDPYSVECVRASMGSIFAVPFVKLTYSEFETWRTQHKAEVSAASVNGTTFHDAIEYGRRSVLLMGNEQSGIPKHIEDGCDNLVNIPMTGGADSLNLAQATAIVSYQIWKEQDYVGAR